MTKITNPQELKAAFPYQFARPIDPWSFGFARGWFSIIVRACEAIDALVREDRYRHRFHWLQIKEKFGTQRLYWQARGMQAIRLDLVTATGVLPLMSTGEGKDRDGLVATQIAAIVRAAEQESARTCSVCGAAGTLRGGDWVLTLCDEHARQSQEGRRLEISFRSEVFGFDWDSAAIPAVPRRARHRAVARFHRERESLAWHLARLEGLAISFPEMQTLAAGAPVPDADPGVRAQAVQILGVCKEIELRAKTEPFNDGFAEHVLRAAECELPGVAGYTVLARLDYSSRFESVLERALLTFASIVLGQPVQPKHAVRGGLLLAQAVLLSAGADPLLPSLETTGPDLAQSVESARQSGDATQLMGLVASWHPDAGATP